MAKKSMKREIQDGEKMKSMKRGIQFGGTMNRKRKV